MRFCNMSSDSEEAPWYHRHLWQLQPVRDALLLLLVYGLFHLGYVLSAITVPMLLALGLSYLLEPLIAWLGRRFSWATRVRVVMGIFAALLLGLALLVVLVVPSLVGQTVNLVNNSERYAVSALDLAQGEGVPEAVRERAQRLRDAFGLPGPASAADPEAKSAPDSTAEDAAPAEQVPGALPHDGPLTEVAVRAIVADEIARRAQTGDDEVNAGAVSARVVSVVKSVGGWLAGVTGGVIGFGLGMFLVVFFFFIFSTAWASVQSFLGSLIPEAQRETVLPLVVKMDTAVSGFVRGRLTIAGILAMVFAIGWTICGVPYALVLGLVVGVFTLVPYLAGVGLIGAYGLLLVYLVGDHEGSSVYLSTEGGIIWWRLILFPAIVFVVGQLMDDYVLTPMIQGKATNLSVAAILVAVMAGGTLAGLYGMLLAIPLAACIKIVVTDVLWPSVQSWLKGDRQDPLPFSE